MIWDPAKVRPRPTPREWRCLEAIRRLLAKNPWTPSQQELADELQVTTAGVAYLLKGLESKGWITREKSRARSLMLAPELRSPELEAKPEKREATA